MLHSIDSTTLVGDILRPASTSFLETQLSRYQTQLADWCNCPSGKTPAGKQKIADLQAKAGATKAQLEQVEAARSQQKVSATVATAVQSGPAPSATGRLIDVVV